MSSSPGGLERPDLAESQALFEVPLASELSNLLNFLVLDIVILPFIMYMSSKLAGFSNHRILQTEGTVTLVELDIPLIGGGLVMPKGWRRILFTILRFSVVAAVAVSNFGLEGRTGVSVVSRMGTLRGPGPLSNAKDTITEVALTQVRCNTRVDNKTVSYGSVIDGECYPDVKDYVLIRTRVFFPEIESAAENCQAHFNCETKPYPTTTYRCDQADVVCNGVPEDSGCSYQGGIRRNTFGALECFSISYAPGDGYLWFCNSERVLPGEKKTLHECWGLDARREDVYWWNETFPSITAMPGKAIFASVYGEERTARVSIPEGKRPVTGVRWRWVLAVAWVSGVALLFAVWVWFHLHRGAKESIHDEHGLVNLLTWRMRGMGDPRELESIQ